MGVHGWQDLGVGVGNKDQEDGGGLGCFRVRGAGTRR